MGAQWFAILFATDQSAFVAVGTLDPLAIEYFVQNGVTNTTEWNEVRSMADQLWAHLNEPTVKKTLDSANQPGRSSAEVQSVFLELASVLGFQSEAKGLFSGYASSALRPDYYRQLGNTGVLLEVERGKTTINNMDLLDFWKCHICEHASYLFLMVPLALRQNAVMAPRHEFAAVRKRLGSFFEPQNYTRVLGLVLFGY